jgi:hypothetical protein
MWVCRGLMPTSAAWRYCQWLSSKALSLCLCVCVWGGGRGTGGMSVSRSWLHVIHLLWVLQVRCDARSAA